MYGIPHLAQVSAGVGDDYGSVPLRHPALTLGHTRVHTRPRPEGSTLYSQAALVFLEISVMTLLNTILVMYAS